MTSSGMDSGDRHASSERGESIRRRLEDISVQPTPASEKVDRSGPRRRRAPRGSDLSEAFHVEDEDRLKDVGKTGASVRVVTNFFTVDKVPSYKIYNYAIFFDPPCQSMLSMSKMIKVIARKHWDNVSFSFSGQSVHIAQKINVLEHDNINWRGQAYKIRFQDTGETVPGTEPFVAYLGLLLRGRLGAIGFRTINRNMFDFNSSARKEIEGFDIYPGIRSSILPRENGRLMLCIDRVNKVVNRQNVGGMISRMDLNSEHGQRKLVKDLFGNSVMTPYNNRFYKIMDIDFESDANTTFEMEDGKRVSYRDYYRDRYHVDIRSPKLPLLITRVKGTDGKKREIRLIPELCQIAGMNMVSPGERASIMKGLCRETIPPLRMRYIDSVLGRITDSKDDKQFPLNISKQPCVVSGRQLREPVPGTPSGSFKMQWREIGRSSVYRVLPLRKWVLIAPDNVNFDQLLDSLMRNMNDLGLKPARPKVEQFPSRGERNDVSEVQMLLDRVALKDVQLVVVLVSNHASNSFYANLKRILCDVYGIPSQFIRERNLRNVKMAVVGKIGVQISCKIGCEAWTVAGGFGEMFEKAMMVGIDCHHSKGTSVAGIVCSLNSSVSKFYSRCFFQTEGQELASNLTLCVKEAVERYERYNKCYPESVIVFRDGIGDGQLEYIGKSECQQMLNAFTLLTDKGGQTSKQPKLTYIVVRKRLNARFFYEDNRGLSNPNGGLVVDTVVTMERWRDFFLIPQRVTQGTATPSHFNILTDQNKFKIDDIQSLAYKLCFMYFNWSGAIRVPSVCQYAHKLAFVAGTCCTREPMEGLHERLYYL